MALKKPNLDDATLRIARRMLTMPPKPHDEMRLGKPRGTQRKGRAKSKKVLNTPHSDSR
jgi:hypothetical protein